MSIVVVHDAIHANVSALPKGQVAGYTTGSSDIKWTAADWAKHPGAVRIDQDFRASETTADVLDVERGAATNSEASGWYRQALASYRTHKRPGQRHPAIYTSGSNVTALVNALIAAGVTSGPCLWVAKWDFDSADDILAITNAAGPFPMIGGQFADGSPGKPYDTSVFSGTWLAKVSAVPHPPDHPAGPPFRHLASWKDTPAGIARRRHTTVKHLAETTVAAYTPEDLQLWASKRLRSGTPYYTDNP